MAVATELERNDYLQLLHPYVIEVLDPVPPGPVKRAAEYMAEEGATKTIDLGYPRWQSLAEAITTAWKKIDLGGEFDLIMIEGSPAIVFKGLGRTSFGQRTLAAGRVYSASVKTSKVWVRTVSGAGTVWIDSLGN